MNSTTKKILDTILINQLYKNNATEKRTDIYMEHREMPEGSI